MNRSLAAGRVAGVLVIVFGLAFGATTLGNRSMQPAVSVIAWAETSAAVATASGTGVSGPLGDPAREPGAQQQALAAQVEPPAQPSRDVARDEDPNAPRIIVSIDQRRLWLVLREDTLLSAPVAVGMNKSFEFEGKRFHFRTPRGTRRVLKKEENPIWTVPEWHYYERARWEGLEVVFLEPDSRVGLSDGTVLVVEGDQVGRINHFGNFWPITPGNEIIFDGKVFVPPMNTQQRRVPNALGPYKLDTGGGYLIHGTHIYNEESVGNAVSHGCVRMSNTDLERLYWMVEPGTTVIIR